MENEDVAKVIEEIRSRGSALVEAFETMRCEEMEAILPDLQAIRDDQDRVLTALENIRAEGNKNEKA